MKIFKWIKWIFSFLILVIALIGIIWGTSYVLHNKGIREDVTKKVKKTIEKVTSNEVKTNLSEIYNIYLNNERHKVKIEYQLVTKYDGEQGVNLYIYFDGKSSLEREVIVLQEIDKIHDVFLLEDIGSNIKINESSFKILKEENTEYLLIDIGIVGDSMGKYYYLFNNNGDLLNDTGILVRDNKKNYVYASGEDFINYYDNEEKSLAKVDGNYIFALEEENAKKSLNLVEYKYYLDKGKLKKEKIVVFEDIIIKTDNAKE